MKLSHVDRFIIFHDDIADCDTKLILYLKFSAMELALSLEKLTNDKLLHLHKVEFSFYIIFVPT